MSRATREQVFAALFDQLKTLPGLATCDRRLKSIQDIPDEGFPAAYQMQGNQKLTYEGTTPPLNTWPASWILCVREPDQSQPPSTKLNQIIDAACAVIQPQPAALTKNTLGGLVEYVAIEGDIEIFEGVLGDRALAILPLKIVLGGF
jgi:hypothetical protein